MDHIYLSLLNTNPKSVAGEVDKKYFLKHYRYGTSRVSFKTAYVPTCICINIHFKVKFTILYNIEKKEIKKKKIKNPISAWMRL